MYTYIRDEGDPNKKLLKGLKSKPMPKLKVEEKGQDHNRREIVF
jgi:hypothetical protein